MWTVQSEELARNAGWHTQAEQQRLLDSHVSIGGMGGAGFPFGLALARCGVQNFSVADMDDIARSNFNRHPGAFTFTEGMNKAEVFGEMVRAINPDAKVKVYTDGVNKDNVEEFVEPADLVYDGIDFNSAAESVRLYRAARRLGKPVLTGLEIGPSAVVTTYMPNGVTFEEVNGLDPNMTIEQIAELVKEGADLSSTVPYIPFKSSRIGVMQAVQEGAPLPSDVLGVELFAALAAHQAVLHLGGTVRSSEPRWAHYMRTVTGRGKHGDNRPKPIIAPNYTVIDLDRLTAKTVKPSKARFYASAALLAVRSGLNLNPNVTYPTAISE